MQSIKLTTDFYNDPDMILAQAVRLASDTGERVWLDIPNQDYRAKVVLLVDHICGIPSFKICSCIEHFVSTSDAFKYLRGEK